MSQPKEGTAARPDVYSRAKPLPAKSAREGSRLHLVVVGSVPAFGRNPGNDLVGILYIVGFAVHAVGRIQTDALVVRLGGVVYHLVDVSWVEVPVRAAVFGEVPLVAHFGVVN